MSIDSIALRFSLRSPSSTSADHDGGDEDQPPARDLAQRRDLGELGDRHELVAGIVCGVDDLRHRLGRLRAVVAVARAVPVVQQQDGAGAEARHRAAARSCRRRAWPCPRRPSSSRRRGSPGPPPPGARTGCGSRAARGRAGSERSRTRRDRGLGACQRARHVIGLGERQQRVVVAVRCDLVTVRADRRDDLGVLVGVPAEHEERRPDLARAQHLEHDGRGLQRRAVVERQRDHAVRGAVAVDDAAEERRVRRERAPREQHDAEDRDREQEPTRPADDRGADHGRDRGGQPAAMSASSTKRVRTCDFLTLPALSSS